jgi:hypothetical protein
MAKDKKSFILYADLIHTVNQLPDDKAGLLFKHLLSYVNDENPTTDDIVVKIAFEPIKQQLKRDLKHWEQIREKRSEAGKASAEKRKQNSTNSTSVKSVEQKPTNSTVNDNVNVNVINILFSEFWNLYDKKTGKDKCEKKWKALKDDERIKIIDVLPKYIDSTPDKQYRKNPITWLNQKCWEDEIEETPKRERTDLEKYLAGEIEAPKIRMGL